MIDTLSFSPRKRNRLTTGKGWPLKLDVTMETYDCDDDKLYTLSVSPRKRNRLTTVKGWPLKLDVTMETCDCEDDIAGCFPDQRCAPLILSSGCVL